MIKIKLQICKTTCNLPTYKTLQQYTWYHNMFSCVLKLVKDTFMMAFTAYSESYLDLG